MRIGGHEVVGELGRGGMGQVLLARGPDGREVALKVLRKTDPGALERFGRESRLLAQLGAAEGFVPFLGAGVDGESVYLVMPVLRGGTLADRIRRGPLSVAEVAALGARLARALGRAHRLGVVHRDVKPANVLHDDAGTPLIADLGLAKHFRREGPAASAHLSATGVARGTPGYMPAEQAADAKNVGPEADVFALGATLYECLAGPAFEGPTPYEALVRVEAGRFEPLRARRPDVPAALARAIERALAREPALRFRDGDAFALALEAARSGEPAPRAGVRALLALGVLAGAAALVLLRLTAGTGGNPRAASARPVLPGRGGEAVASDRVPPAALVRELVDSRQPLAALALAEALLAVAPGTEAWELRGVALVKLGDSSAARASYDRALALDPERASALLNRGLLRRESDLEGALADLDRAILLAPERALPRAERAWAFIFAERPEEAAPDVTSALALDPRSALARAALAQMQLGRGELDACERSATEAIEVAPSLDAPWLTRGMGRFSRKAYGEAASDFERVVAIAPSSASGWEFLGLARQHSDPGRALEAFERAVAIDPRDARLRLDLGLELTRHPAREGDARRELQAVIDLAPRDESIPRRARAALERLRAP